jgi:large subunit ribosomal protein L29
MRAEELRDLTDEELREKEAELKRKLFTLRFQVATGQQDNTAALKETKKDIARVKTILRERELERLRTAKAGGN